MRFTMSDGTVLDNIKMAPFCVHDCQHTHFRWGNFTPLALPKWNRGFSGRSPYAAEGKPLVSASQTVKLGLTSASSFRYVARADGPIRPAIWTVFNHHGSAYALGIGSGALWGASRLAVREYITHKEEPYALWLPVIWVPSHLINEWVTDVDPLGSVPAFYYRLRYTGFRASGGWTERLQIVDLAGCRA
jgi:hypothetical protein